MQILNDLYMSAESMSVVGSSIVFESSPGRTKKGNGVLVYQLHLSKLWHNIIVLYAWTEYVCIYIIGTEVPCQISDMQYTIIPMINASWQQWPLTVCWFDRLDHACSSGNGQFTNQVDVTNHEDISLSLEITVFKSRGQFLCGWRVY